MSKKKYRGRRTKGELILLTIIMLVLGTITAFIMPSSYEPIERADARHIEASYQKHDEVRNSRRRSNHSVNYIRMYFSDYSDILEIETGITKELRNRLDALDEGDRLSMLVHPQLNRILELKAGNETLLSFEESVEIGIRKGKAMRILGIIAYAGALYHLYLLIKGKYTRFIPD